VGHRHPLRVRLGEENMLLGCCLWCRACHFAAAQACLGVCSFRPAGMHHFHHQCSLSMRRYDPPTKSTERWNEVRRCWALVN